MAAPIIDLEQFNQLKAIAIRPTIRREDVGQIVYLTKMYVNSNAVICTSCSSQISNAFNDLKALYNSIRDQWENQPLSKIEQAQKDVDDYSKT